MSVTDAEKAFYESVIDDPVGKSIQDLRYAYFLAAVDGGLPSSPVDWGDVTGKPTTFAPSAHEHPVGDLEATGTPGATTYLRGDGSWSVPPNTNTTYANMTAAAAETGTSTTGNTISAKVLADEVTRRLGAGIPNYKPDSVQVLKNDYGSLVWVDEE